MYTLILLVSFGSAFVGMAPFTVSYDDLGACTAAGQFALDHTPPTDSEEPKVNNFLCVPFEHSRVIDK